jgi:hypothetical protein
VPWCDDCSRFLNPTTLSEDGSCPSCGRVVAEIDDPGEPPRAPWHFKVMVVALVAYLGWRLWEGVVWVFERF